MTENEFLLSDRIQKIQQIIGQCESLDLDRVKFEIDNVYHEEE